MPAVIRREKKYCCAVTGHREITEDLDPAVIEKYIERLADGGIKSFYCGMARGFDLMAAQAVINLKKGGAEVELIACIPCEGQEKFYPPAEKKKYLEILEECDEINYLSENYYDGCMHARDRFMVESCDTLLAYLKKKSGGTFYTCSYARSLDKEIIYIE